MPELRLAEVVTALEVVGLTCLVMGGHAVRYYGFERHTNDCDLHLAPGDWDDLPERLRRSALFAGQEPLEGPSWRPQTFRRFQIGVLPSGREEWLEFWKENHLLPSFAEAFARREIGPYGGRPIAFLSLADLIRTKETERERDWEDLLYLEEFADARRATQVAAGKVELAVALAEMRSRRGFESHFQAGRLKDGDAVARALNLAKQPMAAAFLLPFTPAGTDLQEVTVPIEPVVIQRLRTVNPASPLHLALVEVVRRQYKQACQAADKADKQALRATQAGVAPRPRADES
jgi:hypothetical protein